VQTPLNASASTAGALFSTSAFEVPQFQREYSWQVDEVTDFWNDLRSNIDSDSYFLGLVILTERKHRKDVVDGQQRLITLTLLANAIYHEAIARGREALADRVRADFLESIDYDTDEARPRVILSDSADNKTLQTILSTGQVPEDPGEEGSVSRLIVQSHNLLASKLKADLKTDPFRRLGKWADFLTKRVYFAVFVHPDPSSAYQVYEVINTRGRELTTADLLKNFILSQTPRNERAARYAEWQSIANQFVSDGANNFVQYIRHAVTVQSGHVLPKDLFGFLAGRVQHVDNEAPSPEKLMRLLKRHLPLYLQMIDPTVAGPAESEALKIFSALNALGVIAVRPILLALDGVPNSLEGMAYTLRLVVRRIVVANLGTGNVERRLGEAARSVHDGKTWGVLREDLKDLNPPRSEFVEQLRKRSFKKGVLAFLRRSAVLQTITPESEGVLHFIWSTQTPELGHISEEDGSFWGSTIGNTFLSRLARRPAEASDWSGFKRHMLPKAIDGEWEDHLRRLKDWNAASIESIGQELASVAGRVWY